jgi:hypothetical protein
VLGGTKIAATVGEKEDRMPLPISHGYRIVAHGDSENGRGALPKTLNPQKLRMSAI